MARRDDDEEDDGDGERPSKKKKPSAEDKQMAMLAHLSALVLSFIGPLIFMIMYKDKSKFVERHAKNALNFDITMTLAIFLTCFIGGLIIGPMAMILHIMAALAANDGKKYEYPMTIRFIK